MISPQSIAIACAAVGLVGKESDLFRFTVKHSIIFTVFVVAIITVSGLSGSVDDSSPVRKRDENSRSSGHEYAGIN